MKKLIFLIAIISLTACNSTKKVTSSSTDKYTIENLGNMNADELEKNYPDAMIKEGSALFDEGTDERPYTILYPDTENELHITWQDKKRTKIHDLRYSGKGKWKSETGVEVGSSYEALNKINDKKISLYGFGWDYSGAVVWNGGKLEKSGLQVFLNPKQDPPSRFYGDQIIEATPEEIEAMELEVSSVMINYKI